MSNTVSPNLLHAYFFDRFEEKKDKLAVIHGETEWTYDDLRQRSEHYAEALGKANLGIGDRVLLELDPTPDAIAVILACSMTGLVFIPVGPDTPRQRVRQIAEDSGAVLHVQHSNSMQGDVLPELRRGLLEEGELRLDAPVRAESAGAMRLLETDLSYIIFTSGTTGRPKGIMMSHGAAVSFFKGMNETTYSSSSDYRVGTISPLQFDLSLLDMGMAFGSGHTLVQVPRILVHHPIRFIEYLAQKRVNRMNGVPSIWSLVLRHSHEKLRDLHHLDSILYAGEPFPMADLRSIAAAIPNLTFINCFGQSESIACTFHLLTEIGREENAVSIGKPHSLAEILLLDEQGCIIREPYVHGEIAVRGPTLFSGYWNNKEATAKALIPNPLRPLSGENVFKSGDVAYFDEQGNYYFVGRADLQVKILGNRVEIEEVERRIETHPDVHQAAVVPVKADGLTQLICYLTPVAGKTLTREDILSFCAETLPQYMYPSEVRFVDKIPLNSNGKLDRKALQAMNTSKGVLSY